MIDRMARSIELRERRFAHHPTSRTERRHSVQHVYGGILGRCCQGIPLGTAPTALRPQDDDIFAGGWQCRANWCLVAFAY
jgi:hypothetical protein